MSLAETEASPPSSVVRVTASAEPSANLELTVGVTVNLAPLSTVEPSEASFLSVRTTGSSDAVSASAVAESATLSRLMVASPEVTASPFVSVAR